MPGVSVSIDALTRTKDALNEYRIDISGFSTRIGKQSADISKSARYEMQKIADRIKETTEKVNRLKDEINRHSQSISQMTDELRAAERNLESLHSRMAMTQSQAERLKEQINELKTALAEADDTEAMAKIQEELNLLQSRLSQTETELRRMKSETEELKSGIPQLQQKISDVNAEKAKCEDELRVTEKLLDRLKNKQGRMQSALSKLNESMEMVLTASKSFETRAGAKTDQSIGNIDKCIAAVDAYLSGMQVDVRSGVGRRVLAVGLASGAAVTSPFAPLAEWSREPVNGTSIDNVHVMTATEEARLCPPPHIIASDIGAMIEQGDTVPAITIKVPSECDETTVDDTEAV